tara:strand:+ start:183 stop:674 length:492 start_codon:yes stop_codon:yes gene_type:complete
MKDNKLIAEFMGLPTEVFKPSAIINYYYKEHNSGTWYEEHELSYKVSWDWLIPVVKKCFCTGDNTFEWDAIMDAMWTCDIKIVHSVVVEFINQHNKTIKRIELENTSMIKIGTEVKIIDNFHEHVGYVEDTIVKIIEHDEYENYILSSGHCCSEAEMEIIKTI